MLYTHTKARLSMWLKVTNLFPHLMHRQESSLQQGILLAERFSLCLIALSAAFSTAFGTSFLGFGPPKSKASHLKSILKKNEARPWLKASRGRRLRLLRPFLLHFSFAPLSFSSTLLLLGLFHLWHLKKNASLGSAKGLWRLSKGLRSIV